MSELVAGIFSIQSASENEVWIGINDGRSPVVRVVADRSSSKFRIVPLGNGEFAIEAVEAPWVPGPFLKPEGDYIAAIGPGEYLWKISRVEKGYMITTTGFAPPLAWTLSDPNIGAPVTLSIYGIPQSTQDWRFIPYLE